MQERGFPGGVVWASQKRTFMRPLAATSRPGHRVRQVLLVVAFQVFAIACDTSSLVQFGCVGERWRV
jgi:hypothetical protein